MCNDARFEATHRVAFGCEPRFRIRSNYREVCEAHGNLNRISINNWRTLAKLLRGREGIVRNHASKRGLNSRRAHPKSRAGPVIFTLFRFTTIGLLTTCLFNDDRPTLQQPALSKDRGRVCLHADHRRNRTSHSRYLNWRQSNHCRCVRCSSYLR